MRPRLAPRATRHIGHRAALIHQTCPIRLHRTRVAARSGDQIQHQQMKWADLGSGSSAGRLLLRKSRSDHP